MLTSAKNVIAKMFARIGWKTSTTTVLMTAKEGVDRIVNTPGAIEKTIPLSMEQAQWLETLCETVDWSKQSVANAVVRLDDYTVTMTITQNHLMFDGSALLATMNGMQRTEKD